MLFLEDFLELVEGLPAEVRDKCTLIRELDLSVQNQVELLRKKVDSCSCSSTSSTQGNSQKDQDNAAKNRKVFEDVENGYKQASIDADEKIKVMTQLFDLVERYSRRLDQDLNRFKLELEADNAGVTQILEAKVSRQLAEEETTPLSSHFSPIYSTASYLDSPAKSQSTKVKSENAEREERITSSHSVKKNKNSNKLVSSSDLARQSSLANGSSMSGNPDQSLQSVFFTPPTSPSELSSMMDSNDSMLSGIYSLHLGMESTTNKIAKAFTGRHPHSSDVLNIYPSKNRPKRLLSSEKHRVRSGSGGSSSSVLQSRYGFDTSEYIVPPVGSGMGNRKKRKLDSTEKEKQQYNLVQSDGTDDSSSEIAAADSSEQRWCICNDFSYGNMIACDNLDCPIEWFHYPCVGIPASGTTKRKWYCPDCRLKLKKKSSSSKKL